MAEIERILKEGGYCCIIAPSNGYRHRYPLDCWRFYEDGLSALAKYVDLEVVDVSTQRDRYDFTQFDKTWQDSILICRKPSRSIKSKFQLYIKNKLNKFLVSSFNRIQVLTSFPQIVTQLYWDINNKGFSEDLSKRKECSIVNDSFTVYYDMTDCSNKNLITSIRFDPSIYPLGVKALEAKAILTDNKQYDLKLINSNQSNCDKDIFWFNHCDSILEYDIAEIPLDLLDTIKFQCQYYKFQSN